jgi:hypothetical protein
VSDPRGIRNFNPGNIRHGSITWLGMAPQQTDPAFIQFVSPEYGIRAIARILRNYKAIGLNTIAQAISRWAPYSENNTDAYIAAVCRECSVGPDDVVDYDALMPLIVKAIIWHENGVCPYTDAQIADGIRMAA